MTSLFLALVLQSQPLSLDALAPLSQLAVHLEKDHQIQLTYPPSLEDQVVFVKFNQVQTDEAMKRLATALDCKAVFAEGKWKLERDQVLLAKRKAEEKEERRRQWQKNLDKMAEHAKADFKTVLSGLKLVNPAEDEALSFKSPSGRLISKLLDSIGAAKLAELEPHTTTTFSTSPGSQNKAFSPLVWQFAKAYDREREELRLGLDQLGPQLSNHFLFADPKQRDPLYNQTSEIALTAFIWQNQRLHLTTYDKAGAQIAMQVAFFWGPPEVEPKFLGTDSPLSLPDSDRTVSPHDYAWERSADEAKAIWKQMKDEPLDFLVRPALDEFAENHHANVAMVVPDSAHAAIAAAKPKTEKALALAMAGIGLRLDLKEGWLSSSLKNHSQLGTVNLNRKALADYAESWNDQGLPWLRARCVFAARHPDAARRTDLDDWLAQNVISPIRGGYLFPLILEPEVQRAMGAMTESEWQELPNRKPVEIDPGSRAFKDLVLATHGRDMLLQKPRLAMRDQDKNGAFVFANGPPSDLDLLARLDGYEAVRTSRLGRQPFLLHQAAAFVANTISGTTELEIESALGSGVEIGSLPILTVVVRFGPTYEFQQRQELDSFTVQTRPDSFNDWPKEVREGFVSLVKQKFSQRRDRTLTQPPL